MTVGAEVPATIHEATADQPAARIALGAAAAAPFHAYLIAGPRGSARQEVATAVAVCLFSERVAFHETPMPHRQCVSGLAHASSHDCSAILAHEPFRFHRPHPHVVVRIIRQNGAHDVRDVDCIVDVHFVFHRRRLRSAHGALDLPARQSRTSHHCNARPHRATYDVAPLSISCVCAK
ncbi:MAG: hypothetical protein GEU88_15495 [Solirubrobacterales bacterium]|nr:hypothetical protein [Solirubrobacterales bacterium]